MIATPLNNIDKLSKNILDIIQNKIIVDTESAYNKVIKQSSIEVNGKKLLSLYNKILSK